MNNQDQIPPADLELIERFLQKEMPPDERQAFLNRMAADGALKQAVEEMELLSIGIQEVALQKRIDEFHKEIPAERVVTKRVAFSKAWLAAAAVFVIASALALWLLLGGSNEEKLYATYYQPDPGLPTVMSSTDNYEFYQAMVDYKSGEYEKAIESWDALLQQRPDNDTLHYYIGSAWLAKEEPKKAIEFLEKVSANSNSRFLNDANWYLALARMKEGDKEKAIAALEKTQHARKEELLEALKKISNK